MSNCSIVSCSDVNSCVNSELVDIAGGLTPDTLTNFCAAVSKCVDAQFLLISEGLPNSFPNYIPSIEYYLRSLPGYTDSGDIFFSLSDNVFTWQAGVGGASYTDEEAQDAVGTILTNTSSVVFTYNDTLPSISAAVPPAFVRGLISAGSGITYNSSTGVITNTGSVYTDEQAQDAIGAILGSEFTYNDSTPSITINVHSGLSSGSPLRLGQLVGAIGNPAVLTANTEIPLADYTLTLNNKTGTGVEASSFTFATGNSSGQSQSELTFSAKDRTAIKLSVNNIAGNLETTYYGFGGALLASSGYSLLGVGGHVYLSNMVGTTTHTSVEVGGIATQQWLTNGDILLGLFGTKNTGFGGITSPTAAIDIAASTVSTNPLRIQPGVNPSSNYLDGAIWHASDHHLYARLNGQNKQLDNDYNFTPNDFIQNQFVGPQSTANYWIDGHGRIDDYLQINNAARLVQDSLGILASASSTSSTTGADFRARRFRFWDNGNPTDPASSDGYIYAPQGNILTIHSSGNISFDTPTLYIGDHSTIVEMGGNHPLTFKGSVSGVGNFSYLDIYNSNVAGDSKSGAADIVFSSNRTTSGRTKFAGVGMVVEDFTDIGYKGGLTFKTVDATVNSGIPTEFLALKSDGRIIAERYSTLLSAPATTGVKHMVTCDENGLLSHETIPTGSSGSVTSVGLSMPSAFSVSASPITTAGTILVTGAGNNTQFINGAGNLAAISTISNIYNSDGTTTGTRTVTLASTLNFTGNKIGVDTTSPEAKFTVTTNAIGTTQSDSNGILLLNSTAAAGGLPQTSPGIVFESKGWSTGGAQSLDIRSRIDSLSVQATGNPTSRIQFATSSAGNNYLVGAIFEMPNQQFFYSGIAQGVPGGGANILARTFNSASLWAGPITGTVRNFAVGNPNTLASIIAGAADNTAVGISALAALTTGGNNVGVGSSAITLATSGSSNNAVGSHALGHLTTGSHNNAVGASALIGVTTGSQNTGVGGSSLSATTTGHDNVAIGHNSLIVNTTGTNNVALGSTTGVNITTSIGNTFIGDRSGSSLISGNNNIFLGSSAGYLDLALAASQVTTVSNSIAIGSSSYTTASNQIVIGNTNHTNSIFYGAIRLPSYGTGVITGTPVYTLQVDASGNVIEGSAAGAQNLQQVLTTGATLTGSNTVDVNGHSFVWDNAVDYTIEATGSTFLKIASFGGASNGDVLTLLDNTTGEVYWAAGGGGGGGVSSFSSGDLSPLFTTSVLTATSTPALSFSLTNAGAHTWFGNNTGSPAAPSYTAAGTVSTTNDTNVLATLTGTPTNAALNSFGITMGWTGQLSTSRGGTGISSYAVGDIIRATGVSTLTKLNIGTALQVLRVNSGATDIEWATPNSGTVSSLSVGDLSPLFTSAVATSTTTPAVTYSLTNAGANTYFGNATTSSGAPSYTAAASLVTVSDTNIVLTTGGNAATSLLRGATITASWNGALSAARGGTSFTSYTAGDIIIASGATSLTKLALGTPAQQLRVNAGGTSLEYFTPTPGITSLNTLTATSQTLVDGSSGTDFNIVSSVATHTFNIPSAGIGITRGLVTNSAQTLDGVKTFNVGVVVNESGAASDFRVESDTNDHALYVDAANNRIGLFTTTPTVPVDITGDVKILSGALGIGTAPTTSAPLTIGGSGWLANGIALFPSISSTPGSSPSIIGVTGTIIEAGSGTHPIIAAVNITAPTITGGAATVTNAASLYISGAPSATVTGGNYSILVNAGQSRFNGDVVIGSGVVYSTGGYSIAVRNNVSGRIETIEPDVVSLNSQSGTSYTLVLADKGGMIRMNNASPNTLTIPTNASVAFSIGSEVLVYQEGAGQTTIAAAGGVTINSADGANKLRTQHSTATLIKIATNTWVLSGDVTT